MNETELNATIQYSEGRLDALRLYLKQSDGEFSKTLNSLFAEAVDKLYAKSVPQTVQAYLALISGEAPKGRLTKLKKAKPQRQDPSVQESELTNEYRE